MKNDSKKKYLLDKLNTLKIQNELNEQNNHKYFSVNNSQNIQNSHHHNKYISADLNNQMFYNEEFFDYKNALKIQKEIIIDSKKETEEQQNIFEKGTIFKDYSKKIESINKGRRDHEGIKSNVNIEKTLLGNAIDSNIYESILNNVFKFANEELIQNKKREDKKNLTKKKHFISKKNIKQDTDSVNDNVSNTKKEDIIELKIKKQDSYNMNYMNNKKINDNDLNNVKRRKNKEKSEEYHNIDSIINEQISKKKCKNTKLENPPFDQIKNKSNTLKDSEIHKPKEHFTVDAEERKVSTSKKLIDLNKNKKGKNNESTLNNVVVKKDENQTVSTIPVIVKEKNIFSCCFPLR